MIHQNNAYIGLGEAGRHGHVLRQNNGYVVLSINFVSISSQSGNYIYRFEFFHQMHIFSKYLSRSAITLYGYHVCSRSFGTRLLHARFLYSAYVLSNHRSKLHSYLLSGFPSNFNTCRLGSGNPCREKHPWKKIQRDWEPCKHERSIFRLMSVHVIYHNQCVLW